MRKPTVKEVCHLIGAEHEYVDIFIFKKFHLVKSERITVREADAKYGYREVEKITSRVELINTTESTSALDVVLGFKLKAL